MWYVCGGVISLLLDFEYMANSAFIFKKQVHSYFTLSLLEEEPWAPHSTVFVVEHVQLSWFSNVWPMLAKVGLYVSSQTTWQELAMIHTKYLQNNCLKKAYWTEGNGHLVSLKQLSVEI